MGYLGGIWTFCYDPSILLLNLFINLFLLLQSATMECRRNRFRNRFRRRIEGSWQKVQMPPKYPLLQQEKLLLMLVRVRWAPRRPPLRQAWQRSVRKTVRSISAAAGWCGCLSQLF